MEKSKTISDIASINVNNHIDRQAGHSPPTSNIPIISTLLHVVSMSIIVFLRQGFGYSFMRPIRLFILFSWVTLLFTGFAWTSKEENTVWLQSRTCCAFAAAALILFFYHCLACRMKEWLQKAPHDHFSGRSLLAWKEQSTAQLYIEPILAFSLGAFFFTKYPNSMFLGFWLMFAATCLSIKEALKSLE